MEQEITMQELIALMNAQTKDFIIHVTFGEEADADGRMAENSEEQFQT